MKKLRVLIVDDSALVRQSLASLIIQDPRLEVCGAVADPYSAVKEIQKERPDVITLDIEMPRMDGLTFLKKLMHQHPIPVVIISSRGAEGSLSALKAYEYGAKEVIEKPKLNTRQFFEESSILLCDAIVAAAVSTKKFRHASLPELTQRSYSADVILKSAAPIANNNGDQIIAIGASTGGTEVIAKILSSLKPNIPGIVVVQHMPEHFTSMFAQRIDRISRIKVREAKNGDVVERGTAFIARGNKHLLVKALGNKYILSTSEGPLVNRHRPSVDVLFRSVAISAGKKATGILLTGMGGDGSTGLLEIKQNNGNTLVQDEQSCVVFGMPKKAIELGAADIIYNPQQMISYLNSKF